MSGASHGFRRRFQGVGSGKSTGAKAPLWLGETEKKAVVGSEDLGELLGEGNFRNLNSNIPIGSTR